MRDLTLTQGCLEQAVSEAIEAVGDKAGAVHAVENVAVRLADLLAESHPGKFNYGPFFQLCGIGGFPANVRRRKLRCDLAAEARDNGVSSRAPCYVLGAKLVGLLPEAALRTWVVCLNDRSRFEWRTTKNTRDRLSLIISGDKQIGYAALFGEDSPHGYIPFDGNTFPPEAQALLDQLSPLR